MSKRRWRIQVVVAFPRLLVTVVPPDPGELLPKQLGTETRIPTEQRELGNVRVAMRPSTHPLPHAEGLGHQFDPADLLIEIDAESPIQALERANPLLEFVLDRLAFDLQAALEIVETNVHDVTHPVAVGDDREMAIFATYPGDKFARSEDLGSMHTVPVPSLIEDYDEATLPRVRAALRWYVKTLGTAFLHDRFMFLWIATEVFADDSGIAVTEPLPLRCGHTLTVCPACGKTTENKVRGASIRAYLEARGMDPDMAHKAWRLRQMFHGAIPFDSDKLSDLPAVVQLLRAVVAAELKTGFGIEAQQPPIVVAGVMSIHPSMAVGGSQALTESDLSWPDRTASWAARSGATAPLSRLPHRPLATRSNLVGG